MKISLLSKQALWACAQGALISSISLSLGFYLVMMHPIPNAVRPFSMYFYRQYKEANIVLPELNLQASPEEHLIYMQKMDEWMGLEDRIFFAALAEKQVYWGLASGLIACGLWFPANWLGRKFEKS